MKKNMHYGVIVMITLLTSIFVAALLQQESKALVENPGLSKASTAPIAVTGNHVYVAWWANDSGNDEVFFRASDSRGENFGDKINLSNSPGSDSTRVQINSDVESVVVTWWETNETSNTPVMRVSNDNGKTFGPLLLLAANGTIGS
jgi:hypothetical protein